jgi:hypothetical protein
MDKHTPGPWHLPADTGDALWIGASHERNGGMYVAKLFGPDRAGNAKLIEAAPDMLEALKQATATLVAVTSIVIRADDQKCRPSQAVASDAMFRKMLEDFDKATVKARAAISKASPREGSDYQMEAAQ